MLTLIAASLRRHFALPPVVGRVMIKSLPADEDKQVAYQQALFQSAQPA